MIVVEDAVSPEDGEGSFLAIDAAGYTRAIHRVAASDYGQSVRIELAPSSFITVFARTEGQVPLEGLEVRVDARGADLSEALEWDGSKSMRGSIITDPDTGGWQITGGAGVHSWRSVTDEHGVASLEVPSQVPLSCLVVAHDGVYPVALEPARMHLGEHRVLHWAKPVASTVRGYVLVDGHHPVEPIQVRAISASEANSSELPRTRYLGEREPAMHETVTAKGGEFSLSLPAGAWYIGVLGAGCAPVAKLVETPNAREVVIETAQGHYIDGVAKGDVGSKGVPSLRAALIDDPALVMRASAHPQSLRFRIGPLLPGNYAIHVKTLAGDGEAIVAQPGPEEWTVIF